MTMLLMTLIDTNKNSCKFYAIHQNHAWYGRIGSSPRTAFLKDDPATMKIKKGKKGYVTTIPVSIPSQLAPYNKIKFFRLEGRSLVAYGYLNGFYRPLGMSFTDEQVKDIVSKYGQPSGDPYGDGSYTPVSWFNRWNNGCVTP